MNILIVYDSFFGNTEEIAKAIKNALATDQIVKLLKASDAAPNKSEDFDLLIVGSPTRGFRPTEAINSVVGSLENESIQNRDVAAFDTRILLSDIDSKFLRFIVKTGGYAAATIAKKLKRKGGNLLLPPQGFYVNGEKGPLKEGEAERAANWARKLVKERKTESTA
jgi:flavodoxin